MASRTKILGTLGKLGSKAFVSAATLRQELEAIGADKLERLAKNLGLVRREEFEAVQAMAVAARRANEDLSRRLESVEKKLNGKKNPAAQPRGAGKSKAKK